MGRVGKASPKCASNFHSYWILRSGVYGVQTSKDYQKYHLETSGQYDSWLLQKVIDEVDNSKIMFGTDWPYKYHSIKIEKFNYLNISDENRNKIFNGNARRLWKI
ncbi:amidohydrolase family protein [Enterobacter cloacae complex sp. 339J8]|uniref:amidohydrolase family protein n=1 Tax=Enterobacter cloacae complex sp. 339J8 TaxID=3395869 RepID=UPI003CECF07C